MLYFVWTQVLSTQANKVIRTRDKLRLNRSAMQIMNCYKTTNQNFDATIESLQNYQTPDWFRDAKLGIWSQ